MTNFEKIKANIKKMFGMTTVDFAVNQSFELECRYCVLCSKCKYTNKSEEGLDFPEKVLRLCGCGRTLLDWLESEVTENG